MTRRSLRRATRQFLREYRGLLLLVPLLLALGLLLRWRTTALARPEALAGLLTASMVVLLLGYEATWLAGGRRRLASPDLWQRMAEPSLSPALWLRGALLTAALLLLVLAAARPKGELAAATLTGRGIDLLVCLDVSNSMRVRDMDGRARLDVAKELLGELIDRSAGDRIGLVGFAGSAHAMCPFTLDADILHLFLDDLDYDSVAKQGTALGTAVRTALRRFDPRAECGQVMVLLTDGEDHGTDPLGAAAECRRQGVVLHTIGVGSTTGGPVPVMTDMWGYSVTKRYQGREVTSQLDEPTLQRMATTTGGRYFRADTPGRLEQVLSDISRMDQSVLRAGRIEMRQEMANWYLAPALLLLAMEPLLVRRRRREGRA